MDSLDRRIFHLAVPALGALVAEPLFLLTDTAMVGHLGADALASLGVASTIITTLVGLLIFLAYATTPLVARRLGSGDRTGALSAGIDGVWLAAGLGVFIGVAGYLLTPVLIGFFPATSTVSTGAAAYVSISWWGLPGMLIVLAATGVLRGLQDTKMPLVVAIAGFGANAGLNALLIYGLGLGLEGSAWGTVIAQWGMAAVFTLLILTQARTHRARLLPGRLGLVEAARSGSWLLLRTLSLRIALVATVLVATAMGTKELAAWHIVFTLFSLLALALDALAIAGQALIGHDLGAGNQAAVRLVTHRLIRWGFLAGGALAALTGLLSPLIPLIMTSDDSLRSTLWPVIVLLGLTLPLSAFVFVLDGVLIGAGDGKYLAITGLLNVAMYAPLLWLAPLVAFDRDGVNLGGLLALEAAFGIGYIGARALTLGMRYRGEAWLVVGKTPA